MSGEDIARPFADIVAAAGLSNDTFYRHVSSKDALVAAILEDGAERLCGYCGSKRSPSTAMGTPLKVDYPVGGDSHGVITILPRTRPDSSSRCASATSDSGSTCPTSTWSLP